jgi:hypothetical protein
VYNVRDDVPEAVKLSSCAGSEGESSVTVTADQRGLEDDVARDTAPCEDLGYRKVDFAGEL